MKLLPTKLSLSHRQIIVCSLASVGFTLDELEKLLKERSDLREATQMCKAQLFDGLVLSQAHPDPNSRKVGKIAL